jgi:hypothetical protein
MRLVSTPSARAMAGSCMAARACSPNVVRVYNHHSAISSRTAMTMSEIQ